MKIYHNPRCSKSRETLQILQDAGVEPEVIEYLKTPPSEAELAELLDLLGLEPQDLMRKKEDLYRELSVDPSWSHEKTIRTMVEYPKLIERPIVVSRNRAVIGRPPKAALKLVS